ncbi:hypothetical protein L207DRAFT_511708 [Hyaloscypha variabilis F]|uniref:Cysteine proteinase n=1 Tax=Hyaloscypha variabilis (strain UAMH 11265 / GT02V1 / F) TaxID=1149755 RepID=A0A2J6RTW9_HYAVF|nr:hypothetical protein L207DRAFT_511708 [Hyaloscypha variabilis F]
MPINGGFIAGGFDAQDRAYSYLGDRQDRDDFKYANLWDAHKDWLSPIYDQYDSGSCVANATAALVRYIACKGKQTNKEIDVDGALSDPSRLFIYYHARAIAKLMAMEPRMSPLDWPTQIKEDPDGGCAIRNAMKGLNLVGIAPEKAWPFVMNREKRPVKEQDYAIATERVVVDVNDRPSLQAYRIAQTNYTFEYCRLDPDHTREAEDVLTEEEKDAVGVLTLARLKQCLVEGYPVVFGFNFYEDLSTAFIYPAAFGDAKELEGHACLQAIPPGMEHKAPNQKFGAHAVLAVGFSDDVPTNPKPTNSKDKPKGGVLCQNSWGDDSKDPQFLAHFWIPYQYILDFEATDDFWMLRLFNKDPPKSITRADFQRLKPPHIGGVSPTEMNPALGSLSTFAIVSDGDFGLGAYWIDDDASIGGLEISGRYDLNTFRIYPKRLAPPGQAFKGAITAVSRSEKHTEIWWIGSDGSIQGTWSEGRPFESYLLRPTDTAMPNGGLTSVSMSQGHSALWWVCKNGSVRGTYRQDGHDDGKWQPDVEIVPADYAQVTKEDSPETRALPTSTLASVKSAEGVCHVFWIDKEGAVMEKIWKDGSWYTNMIRVAPPESAALGSRIAAVSRAPGIVDVFFISPSGSVKHWYSKDLCIWQEDKEFTSRVSKMLYPTKDPKALSLAIARVDSDIKAISISPDRLDVFWVHPNNSLCQAQDRDGKDLDAFRFIEPGVVMPGSPLGVGSKGKSIMLIFKAHAGETVMYDTTKGSQIKRRVEG